MVTKSKTAQKKGKVEVGKLKINKETVKDLTSSQAKAVRGGKGNESEPVVFNTRGKDC